jgi:hypothetical protein
MRRLLLLLLLASCTTEEVVATSEQEIASAIPRGSTWKYWDRGGDLGTAWRGSFDDASWASGAGPLGYGESYLRTTVGYGPSASAKYITTYFRRTFTVADPAAVRGLFAELMYDDGVVVYLNGVEIERDAMPAGTTTAATLSSGHEAGNSYGSRDWTAHKGRLVAGTNVIAVEVHQQAASSSDLVFDLAVLIDADAPQPPPPTTGGIPKTSTWAYWDGGGDQGTSWRGAGQRTLLDGGWSLGQGAFGYGESYLRTIVGYGPDPTHKFITTYFQHEFTVADPALVTAMIAEVMYDDGFVGYLNGIEIARAAMPAGTITASTLSSGHETGNAYDRFDWTAVRGLLVAGVNTLAVEVHQAAPSSSDLSFDLGLTLTGAPPPPPGEDIPRRATWKFFDQGIAPALSWRGGSSFDDSTWASGPGPLGYGESYVATPVSYGPNASNKYITTYFRRTFTVDAPSTETRLIAELMYDDGVVVYLNGNEISRLHMPAGAIGNATLSTGHETGNAYEQYDWSAWNRFLVPGTNLLAVEVHQAAATSSDLTFDLSLAVDNPTVCGIPFCGPAVPPAPQVSLTGVWRDVDRTWVIGGNGTIGHRPDSSGGWCWCQRDPGITYSAIWGSDTDLWIVGNGGKVIRYDGAIFHDVDVGTSVVLQDVWGSGRDDVWVVGMGGTVRHFDGTTWTARDLGVEQNLRAVFGTPVAWAESGYDIWVGGVEPAPAPDPEDNGSSAIIYRWHPSSSSWFVEMRKTTLHGGASVAAISGVSGWVWAVGADGPSGAACSISNAWQTDADGGWIESRPTYPYYECDDYFDVVVHAPGAPDGVWIMGGPKAIRYTGGVWSEVDLPTTDQIYDVDYRGTEMWAVGENNRIIRWDGTSSRWVVDR